MIRYCLLGALLGVLLGCLIIYGTGYVLDGMR